MAKETKWKRLIALYLFVHLDPRRSTQYAHQIRLFHHVEDKDVFQAHYKQWLARRLLQQPKLQNEEEEVAVLDKLRKACGAEFTGSMTKMMADIKLSQALTKEFLQASPHQDMSVQILTSGFWPMQPASAPYSLPSVLDKMKTAFETYYAARYTGRCLTWLYALSKGEVVAYYNGTRYSFQLFTPGLMILLLYNDATVWTLTALCERTGLSKEMVEGQVSLLLQAKLLLLSAPAEYRLNTTYQNKKTRVNLAVPIKQDAHVAEMAAAAPVLGKSILESRRMIIQVLVPLLSLSIRGSLFDYRPRLCTA